jgi:ribosome biogenesis GTPase
MPDLKTGRVLRTVAKVGHVEVEGRVIQAAPRGSLYATGGEVTGEVPKNPVAVGDQVMVDDSTKPASLESVLPRKNSLSRIVSSHDPREQILAANVDQLFVIGSIREPLFSSSRTDRILAACAWNEIPAVVVLNKIDLVEESDLAAIRETYERIPVPVIATCAKDGRGIDELVARLPGKTSVFYGSSGAGKSTLLNRIQPGLKLKEGKISRFWDTGKHTTSFSQLYTLDSGACVIDTPGIRVFRLHGVTVANLPDLFPDFAKFHGKCQFDGCSHDHEPECAVFEAVDRGELAASRYASYVELLDEMRGTPAAGADDSGE